MPASSCSAGRRCSSPCSASPTPSLGCAQNFNPGANRRPCQRKTLNLNQTFQRRPVMEVILLERVAKLGQMGEVVRVRDGYARNFLLKRNKALRATADNRAKFEGMKADLEARNLKAKGEAAQVAEKINGHNVTVLRQASDTGQLF